MRTTETLNDLKERLFPNGIATLPDNTFHTDFALALMFGHNAVLETYDRVKKEWLSSPDYWTAAVVAINILSWQCYERNKQSECDLFSDLYYRARDDFYNYYASDSASDKLIRQYFFDITD